VPASSCITPETVNSVPSTLNIESAPSVITPAKEDVPVDVAIVPPLFVIASVVE